MSRIGKKSVSIPDGVEVTVAPPSGGNQIVTVKGPKGELNFSFKDFFDFKIKDKEVNIELKPKYNKFNAIWGTTRSILSNMIEGVTKGFEKKLELQGTGYRVNLQGKKLVMALGYSHPVEFEAPEGIEFQVDKNIITVTGIDKQQVGEVAAVIRSKRKVEPYKGKGLRYVGEYVRRKEGKKAVGEGA